jgi:hypothetical protein
LGSMLLDSSSRSGTREGGTAPGKVEQKQQC